MDKITLILKEELKKESNNYLIESFNKLSNIDNKDLFIEKLTETTIELLNNGYYPDEIALVVEQIVNTQPSIPTATPDASQSTGIWGNLKDPATGKFNFWDAILGGGKSMFFEQLLRYLLVDMLGMSELKGQSLAIFFTEVGVKDLIRLFKGKDYCMQGVPNVARGIVEIFINNAQFGGQSQNAMSAGGASKVAFRNMAMEAVRESNLDDIVGQKICDYIWK